LGTDPDYWKLRNSYGHWWGENGGYFRIKRTEEVGLQTCKVLYAGYYPTLD
jgi:hypothetical protein